jgi:hypothetical protein
MVDFILISSLNTKVTWIVLNIQSVPRSKHIPSRYKNQSVSAV